jgi:hypothetical protein
VRRIDGRDPSIGDASGGLVLPSDVDVTDDIGGFGAVTARASRTSALRFGDVWYRVDADENASLLAFAIKKDF